MLPLCLAFSFALPGLCVRCCARCCICVAELIPFIFVGISPALAPPMAGAAGRCLIAAGRGLGVGVAERGGVASRGGGVFAGGGVGCAGGGGCACCLAGGALVRDGAVSTGGAAAAAGKGPNNVILASASSDSSCTMRCAPKAWMRSARWPCSNACSAVLVPAMLPCGAVPCGAVQGEGGGRFEQRLAEHAAVLKLKSWTHKQSRTAQAVQRQHSCPPGEVGAEDDDLGGARLGWWVGKGRAGTEERTAEVIHQEAHGCAKACGDLRADAGSVTRRGAEYPARCGAVIGPLSRAACPTKKKWV